MWRNVASNGIMLIIALMIGATIAVTWAKGRYEAAGPLAEAICVTVDRGAGIASVTSQLVQKGAVTDGWVFSSGAKYEGKAGDLKFGSYVVPAGASMRQIVDLLTVGGASTCGSEIVYRIRVTGPQVQVREFDSAKSGFSTVAEFDPREAGSDLPEQYSKVKAEPGTRIRVQLVEGVTSYQVVEALNAAEFLKGEIAAVPAEGRLAPESYEVADGADRAQLLAKMQELQDQRLAEIWAARAEGLPFSTPEEALIVASIIEKETGVAAERELVSSVLSNRLRRGIPLGIDAVIEYGVSGGKGPLGRSLRQSELDRNFPYASRKQKGLPPTPISNPGKAALLAAVTPATTDYIYFVADGTGGHVFAATEREHNENVAKWRQIEAERNRSGGGN